MSINFRSLQERLRERLLAQIEAGELTGLQLARETGFQQAHISNFLNRKRGLSLEAMDAMLGAAGIALDELMNARDGRRQRARASEAERGNFVTFPVVALENCTAVHVPKSAGDFAIQVTEAHVRKLHEDMVTPRPHWQRFVAVRVSAEDAEAMSPKLMRGAVAGIDRHYNSLRPWGRERNVYLVRVRDRFALRYVEQVGEESVARAESASVKLERLEEGMAGILGRVCWVWSVL